MSYTVTTDELIRIVQGGVVRLSADPPIMGQRDLAEDAVAELRARIEEDKNERSRDKAHNAETLEKLKNA